MSGPLDIWLGMFHATPPGPITIDTIEVVEPTSMAVEVV